MPRVRQDGTKIDHVARKEQRDNDGCYTQALTEAHASRLVCSYLRVDCPSAGLQPTVASVGLLRMSRLKNGGPVQRPLSSNPGEFGNVLCRFRKLSNVICWMGSLQRSLLLRGAQACICTTSRRAHLDAKTSSTEPSPAALRDWAYSGTATSWSTTGAWAWIGGWLEEGGQPVELLNDGGGR